MGIDAQIPCLIRYRYWRQRQPYKETSVRLPVVCRVTRAPVALVEDVIHAAVRLDVFRHIPWHQANDAVRG